MAHNLSEEKLIEFKTAFEVYDKNKDGIISVKELGSIIRSLGQHLSDANLQEMIVTIDKDGSGTIDFDEFIGLIINKMKDSDFEDEMKEAFSVFDKDGNKFITSHEMRSVLNEIKVIPEDEIEEIIREADIDGDGQIDYEEFIRMVNSK